MDTVSFWSALLPAKGKPVLQEVESTESVLSSIHVTGLALGANASAGPHVITLDVNGVNTVLATLEAPHTRQYHLDISLDQTYQLRNLGDSEVHAYGYQVVIPVYRNDSDEESDEDYELGEDEEEEEDDIPLGVPLNARKPKAGARGRAAVASPNYDDAMDTEDEEDEDEEDDEDDEDEEDDESDEAEEGAVSEEGEEEDGIPEMGDLGSDDVIAEAAGEDEEEEEKDSEEEEEEEPPAKVGGKRAPQTPQPGKPAKLAKQEPPKSAPPKQQQQQQREKAGAKQIPVKEEGKPQLIKVDKNDKALKAKKAKPEQNGRPQQKVKPEQKSGKAAGGTVPVEQKPPQQEQQQAGTPKGVKAPGSEDEYKSALVEFIRGQRGGAVPLSQLGSAVKRPPGLELKLAGFLKKHSDMFAVTADNKVSLAAADK